MTQTQYKAKLINGKPFLYQKSTPQGEWEDITQTLYNVDHLELYDLDINLTRIKECRTRLCGLIFKISLNFMCYHLKLGDKLLWSYCEDPFQGLPIQLLFNLKRNTMSLLFKENRLKSLDMVGYSNDWVEPGKLLTRFKTRRTITDGKTEVIMFGEEQCLEVEIQGKIIWKHEEGPVPISLISDPHTHTLVFPNHYTLIL
ncbi:hypothetical protein TpMuguga_02g00865 [Theileria parva strain Muguga]|uniref:Uncharacterized protein n=1 Tax=Theileria parva TaxID=5875 RepID=Q4N3X3_THEPA|nr:uncharacterized protein TpMuguga_02g00865 [Theileria parva strain Muguga]EAN33150.1 hypothetical protein TpMuguga_02g00865 [Theileria parva strain Muguga]|eukprot:XP_765433.1 hypothetical protein [Theileria parva strain Muguga]